MSNIAGETENASHFSWRQAIRYLGKPHVTRHQEWGAVAKIDFYERLELKRFQ